jgi:hypothetical protein
MGEPGRETAKTTPQEEAVDIGVFNGVWEGKSVSEKNDQTFWKNTRITFTLNSDGSAATVSGSGMSLWRSYRIPFEVTGRYDCKTKEITLVKEHKGQYTNSVEYKALLIPSRGIISGDYANGVIVLKFKSTKDLNNPELSLTGKWSGESRSRSNDPTSWTDTELTFLLSGDGVTGTIEGHGLSLWRNLQIEFIVEGTFNWDLKEITLRKQHLGRYTNMVDYRGVLLMDGCTIEGEYANGTIHLERLEDLNLPSPETIRLWTMTDDQKEEMREREMRGREKAGEAKQIENLLSGVWGGESVDTDDNVTSWTETAMKFHLHPISMKGTIEGQGVSEWREMSIDFVVTGEFDWGTKEVKLDKQHKGRYTNRITYNGWLRERGGKWTIEGAYAKGVISLKKVRDFFVFGSGKTSNEGSKVAEGKKQGVASDDDNDEAAGVRMESTSTVEDGAGAGVAHKLARYEMFLAGMLSSGRQLNPKDQLTLVNFRNTNGITDDEHWSTVKRTGYSKADFKALMIGDDHTQDMSEDTCKICFVEKINAVILPCGHFSLCIDCGRDFMRRYPTGGKCPICRITISQIIQIYRS